MKQYMVIETFRSGRRDEVYQRFREQGRMLPKGLYYLDSWLEAEGERCFQLMETSDPELFEEWSAHWSDLVGFEILELMRSEELPEEQGGQTARRRFERDRQSE